MTAASENYDHVSSADAEWRTARFLYPLYLALTRECAIEVLPCDALEGESDHPSAELLASAKEWFSQIDERIEVHQLRHFLQTTSPAGTFTLQALLVHHLRKPERSESNRNKIDFLLVQFFSLSVSSSVTDANLDLSYVAEALEPVLGQFDLTPLEWLEPLDDLTLKSESCRTLKQLFTSRIIEQGRKLKESCGDNYYLPVAMTAFTRFGFLLRRTFFRLMHQDLNAILDGLRQLEALGVEGLDCRRAQFSAYEPMLRLRMICQSWKVMFHAEYSAGQPLCLLVDLRTVVDAALVKSISKAQRETDSGAQQNNLANAAAAGFGNFGASVAKSTSQPSELSKKKAELDSE